MTMKWMLLNTTSLCRRPEDGSGAGDIIADQDDTPGDTDDLSQVDDQADAAGDAPPAEPEWSDEEADEARAFGWKAPDEWGGEKPPTYVGDPRSYMERIQNSKPFKVLTERQAKLEAEFSERARKLDEMNARAMEAQRAKYEADMQDITARQRRAVELADPDAFDALEKQRSAMVAPEPVAPVVPDVDPYVQEYAKQNDWVNNPVLRDAGSKIIDANPAARAMSAKDQLAYAEQEVRKMYPAYFTADEPDANKPAPRQRVDGGGLGSAAAQAKDPFNKLPTEAKAAFKRFVSEGIFENTAEGRKAYVADYNG